MSRNQAGITLACPSSRRDFITLTYTGLHNASLFVIITIADLNHRSGGPSKFSRD
jgi:hypothetical protein